MVKLDPNLIDKGRQFAGNVRDKDKKKKIAEDDTKHRVLFGLVMRFHPTRPELTEILYGLFPKVRDAHKSYSKRTLCNNDVRQFNTINKYDQQIIGQRSSYPDLYGKKRYTSMLYIADNETAGRSAEEHERPRDGYNEKIKRLRHIERDVTVKKRARKLLQEIER